MRVAMIALVGAVLGLATVACQSKHEEGVTSSYHSQWTDVAAGTKATTNAAKAVLEAEGLKSISASSTDLDGTAEAKKADGTKIAVTIKQAGAGSQVTVTVGTLGDPTIGAELAKKIKDKAEAH